jgi:hypothetical protein
VSNRWTSENAESRQERILLWSAQLFFVGAYEATVKAHDKDMALLNSGSGSLQETRRCDVSRLENMSFL